MTKNEIIRPLMISRIHEKIKEDKIVISQFYNLFINDYLIIYILENVGNNIDTNIAKLWSVFNLFKDNKKKKNYITYESFSNVAKALNLKIDSEKLKMCFQKYNDELKFEEFKKLILGDEEKEDKLTKDSTKNGGLSAAKKM